MHGPSGVEGLTCPLCLQAADEAKQMVTYKQDYFNSPWNYFDCASIIIIAILFLLHISRLNHQVLKNIGCSAMQHVMISHPFCLAGCMGALAELPQDCVICGGPFMRA